MTIHWNTIETILSALRTDIEHAINWFTEHCMKVNPSKFQFMILQKFTSKEIKPEFIQVHGTFISCNSEVKLLGITIDGKLKFDKYVALSCKHAARQLNVLFRFKSIFDLKEREQINNTFILSNFNYCRIAWHVCGKVDTETIEKIQERELRFMFNDNKGLYSSILEKWG